MLRITVGSDGRLNGLSSSSARDGSSRRRGQLLIAHGRLAGQYEDAFKLEARMLQRCCHPNIVETFEAWYSR